MTNKLNLLVSRAELMSRLGIGPIALGEFLGKNKISPAVGEGTRVPKYLWPQIEKICGIESKPVETAALPAVPPKPVRHPLGGSFWFTEPEIVKIKSVAAANNLSVSNWIKSLIIKEVNNFEEGWKQVVESDDGSF